MNMNSTKKLSRFNNVFQDMLLTRLEYLDISLFRTKECCDVEERLKDLYNKIETLLTDEDKKLIERYEEAKTEQQALSDHIIYEQGLKDGVELTSLISN